jgi:hypothetical protein
MSSVDGGIRRHFEFLIRNFGFAEVKRRRSKSDERWLPLVVYANATTVVSVSYDVREASCGVAVYPLRDGELPSDAFWGVRGLPLPAIVELTQPDRYFGTRYSHSPEFDDPEHGLDRYLEYHATALRRCAADLLRGNFACAPRVDAVLDRWVAQRAESARDDEACDPPVGFDLHGLDLRGAIRNSFQFLIEKHGMRQVRRRQQRGAREWKPGVLYRNALASVYVAFVVSRARAIVKIYPPGQAHIDDTLLEAYGYRLEDILSLDGKSGDYGTLLEHVSKKKPAGAALADYLDQVADKLRRRAKRFLAGDFSQTPKVHRLARRRERLAFEQALAARSYAAGRDAPADH